MYVQESWKSLRAYELLETPIDEISGDIGRYRWIYWHKGVRLALSMKRYWSKKCQIGVVYKETKSTVKQSLEFYRLSRLYSCVMSSCSVVQR